MLNFLISNIDTDLYEVHYNRGIWSQDSNKTIKIGSFRVSSLMNNDLVIEDTHTYIYPPVVRLSYVFTGYQSYQGSVSIITTYGRRSLVLSL